MPLAELYSTSMVCRSATRAARAALSLRIAFLIRPSPFTRMSHARRSRRRLIRPSMSPCLLPTYLAAPPGRSQRRSGATSVSPGTWAYSRVSPGIQLLGPRSPLSGAESELASDCKQLINGLRSNVGDEHLCASHKQPSIIKCLASRVCALLPTCTPRAINSSITSRGRRGKGPFPNGSTALLPCAGHRSLLDMHMSPTSPCTQKAFQWAWSRQYRKRVHKYFKFSMIIFAIKNALHGLFKFECMLCACPRRACYSYSKPNACCSSLRCFCVLRIEKL